MSAEEFDATSPGEIASYLCAWQRREERENYRAAIIVCSIQNLFRKEPIEPGDVFPGLPTSDKEITPEELAGKILSVAYTFGAKAP